jgi:hypothetical protein
MIWHSFLGLVCQQDDKTLTSQFSNHSYFSCQQARNQQVVFT